MEQSRGGGDYRDLYQPRGFSCTPRSFSADVLVPFGQLLDHVQHHRDDRSASDSWYSSVAAPRHWCCTMSSVGMLLMFIGIRNSLINVDLLNDSLIHCGLIDS